MTKLGKIAETYADLTDPAAFSKAMKEMRHVPEGELWYQITYHTEGQSTAFKRGYALAQSELARRSLAEQKKLSRASAIFGIFGVLVGVALQYSLTNWADINQIALSLLNRVAESI